MLASYIANEIIEWNSFHAFDGQTPSHNDPYVIVSGSRKQSSILLKLCIKILLLPNIQMFSEQAMVVSASVNHWVTL